MDKADGSGGQEDDGIPNSVMQGIKCVTSSVSSQKSDVVIASDEWGKGGKGCWEGSGNSIQKSIVC